MKKVIKRSIILVLLVAITLASGYELLKRNIHTVVPDEAYRSAQLTGVEFQNLIESKHIRSIINLRGSNPHKLWYLDEVKTAKQLGVKHFDIPMRAYVLPAPRQLKKLVEFIQQAPEPMLLHCKSGADRAGLASAITLLLHNKPLPQAKKQISYKYFATSKSSVGRLVLPYYGRWLEQRKWKSNRQRFLQWVDHVQKMGWKRSGMANNTRKDKETHPA